MMETKKKKGFMDGYKTYNTSDGFGSRESWQKSFNTRMGYDDAVNILDSKNPYDILGVVIGCSINDIKKAFRKLAKQYHPDVNQSPDANEKIKQIIAAYTILNGETKF